MREATPSQDIGLTAPEECVVRDGTGDQERDGNSCKLGDRFSIFNRFTSLIRIQLCSHGGGNRDGGTEHAHTTSLFFIQLGAFAGQDFLLEQKIGTCKLGIDAAGKCGLAAGEHMNDLPAIQAMFLQSRDLKSFAQ